VSGYRARAGRPIRGIGPAAAFLLACGGSQAQAADCPTPPPGAQVIEQAPLKVYWTAEPAPIGVSRPFALRLGLCPARAELLRVDASMPEHRHGMNYRVSLARDGTDWLARGLVWHMPGRWELLLVLRLDGEEHRLLQSMVLR
jgi:hypothetical protein